jgi:UDP-glucuronate decarboxylase
MHLQNRVFGKRADLAFSDLICAIARGGAQVICLDNFFTGARSEYDHFLDNRGCELIRRGVIFAVYVELDQIYNLARPASPIRPGADHED